MDIYLAEAANYARDRVAQHLEDLGHGVSVLADLNGVLAALADDPAPDLIIADLPPGRGPIVGAQLRRIHRRHPAVPVLLRVSSEVLPAAMAAHCGVQGYLAKPFRPEELELLLLRLEERRAQQTFQDGTGLYTRAGFAALADQQLKAARRTGTDMVLLRADVGDDAQHAERAVAQLGRVVQQTFRDADLAGRVNGTDCGVLLLDASPQQTDVALSRLEQNLAAHNADAEQPLRVRVGVAHFDPKQPRPLAELVARADAAETPERRP